MFCYFRQSKEAEDDKRPHWQLMTSLWNRLSNTIAAPGRRKCVSSCRFAQLTKASCRNRVYFWNSLELLNSTVIFFSRVSLTTVFSAQLCNFILIWRRAFATEICVGSVEWRHKKSNKSFFLLSSRGESVSADIKINSFPTLEVEVQIVISLTLFFPPRVCDNDRENAEMSPFCLTFNHNLLTVCYLSTWSCASVVAQLCLPIIVPTMPCYFEKREHWAGMQRTITIIV